MPRPMNPIGICRSLRTSAPSDLDRLPRQKSPMAVLLQPDHQNADLHRVDLAVALVFAGEDKAGDRIAADDVGCFVAHADGLPARLHGPVYELGLVLHLAARMAVAELFGGQ